MGTEPQFLFISFRGRLQKNYKSIGWTANQYTTYPDKNEGISFCNQVLVENLRNWLN